MKLFLLIIALVFLGTHSKSINDDGAAAAKESEAESEKKKDDDNTNLDNIRGNNEQKTKPVKSAVDQGTEIPTSAATQSVLNSNSDRFVKTKFKYIFVFHNQYSFRNESSTMLALDTRFIFDLEEDCPSSHKRVKDGRCLKVVMFK